MGLIDRGVLPYQEPVWGFPWTETPEIVGGGDHRIFYVDPAHPNASDSNQGTDPQYPFATMTACLTAATNPLIAAFDTVYLCSDLTESVITPDYSVGPSNINIIGAGTTLYAPYWDSDDNAAACLDIRAPGYRVKNIRFGGPTTAPCVWLRCTVPNADDISIFSVIEDCQLYGQETGLSGIDLFGAPYEVKIRRCEFCFFHNAGGTACAITATNTAWADPCRIKIEDCIFYENDNHIDASFNVSVIKNNVFISQGQYPATINVDLRGGTRGENAVVGNQFPDDYSQPGGYWANAGAPGCWAGNFSEDTAEAEVGDNGLTTAPPAP